MTATTSATPKSKPAIADEPMKPLSYSNNNDLKKRVINRNGRKGFLESFDNVYYEVIKEKNDEKLIKK